MIDTPITIETMHPKYNGQLSRLLVYGFRGKFQTYTNLTDDKLALFFEKLLNAFPLEPASHRVIALQNNKLIGSLAIKWKPEAELKQEKQNFSLWDLFKLFDKWDLFKLFLSLYFLNHTPKPKECYIADVSVHPAYRGKGIGRLLLQWALQYVRNDPKLNVLSLHVAGKNTKAKHLYEQLAFQTHYQKTSFIRYFLFNERKWDYMMLPLK